MSAAVILDRLEAVKCTGERRWLAKCPSHDDRSPSLSIRELDDGRMLLHCFAGCDTGSVLSALRLEMTDLFPERLDHHRRPSRSRIPAADVLELIDHQAMIVVVIAADIAEHRAVDEPTFALLAEAASRIGEARDLVTPARLKR